MTAHDHQQLSTNRWLTAIVIPLALFFLSLTLYGHSNVKIPSDLSCYLSVALNVLKGNGFVDSAGQLQSDRVGFPLILAGVIWLFNGSLSAVVGFIECVAAIFVVLIYQLGLRLYGSGVGLIAALLFLGSPRLIFFVPRHIDPLWPVFLLASLLILLSRSPREKIIGLSSGLLAALAISIKEVAVLYLALPILLAAVKSLPWARRRYHWFYLGAIAPLLSWLIASYIGRSLPGESSSVSQLYLTFFHDFYDFGWTSLLNLAGMGVQGLWRYFAPTVASPGLFGQIPESPLMLASLIWVGWNACRGDLSARVLVIVFVVFTPFLAAIGEYSMRLSQSLLTLAVMFISLAWAILRTAEILAQKLQRWGYQPVWWKFSLIGVFLTVIMASNVLLDKEVRRLALHRHSHDTLKNVIPESDRDLWEWLSTRLQTMAEFLAGRPKRIFSPGQSLARWLETSAKPGETMMVDNRRVANGVYWFSQGKLPILVLPYWDVSDKIGLGRYPATLGHTPEVIAMVPVFRKIDNLLYLFLLLNKDRLSKAIIQRQVRFLAVSQDNQILQVWLSAHPGFRLEATVADSPTYLIFRVLDNFSEVSPPTQPVFIPAKAVALLGTLKDNLPQRFEWYKKRLLQHIMRFDDATVAGLLEGKQSIHYRIIQ